MEILQEYMEEEENAGRIIDRFHDEMTMDERLEFIVVLEKMLWFGPSVAMKRFVRLLLERGDAVSSVVRCRMAEQVYEADDPQYIARIREWITRPDMEVACRIEWLHKISNYPTYTTDAQLDDWMMHIFHHPAVALVDAYRYKILLDAGNTYDEDVNVLVRLIRRYKNDFADPVMYRIMLMQYLMRRDVEKRFEGDADVFLGECLDELMDIMRDNTNPFEVQADVCDFFLNTKYDRIKSEYREEAQRKMSSLFQENMTSSLSIFSNRQNVHSESIEAASQDILEQLHGRYGHTPHDFQRLQKWRAEMEAWQIFIDLSNDEQDKIIVAMNRVGFDKRMYGKTGDTLTGIFALVWRHIHQSDHRDELRRRLLEELIEASGQCSTGFAVRLLNTLSGFDDFMLKISYRDAIMARVIHHLNGIITSMEDEDKRAVLLEEMTVASYTERKNFLELFRREVPSLKEKLYEEFRGDVSDTDFDLYLRTALLHYENA